MGYYKSITIYTVNAMKKPTLYILCGLPFSGKTVLTSKLINVLDLAKVSIDEIKFAHGFTWSEDENMSGEDWKKIFSESYDNTREFLIQGRDVIYDSANQDRASRDRLRALASDGDFLTKVIHLDTPFEVIHDRREKNKTLKNRFQLPDRFFNAAFENYEPPTKDENVITYNDNTEFDSWIKNNFNNV